MAELLVGTIKAEGRLRGSIATECILSGQLTTTLPDGGYERGYKEGLAARTYEKWTFVLTDGTVVEKEVAML